MPKADDDPNTTTPLTSADLDTTINGEPRILDLRLAEALGFRKPRDIRPLIQRHMEALERFGGICRTVRQNTGRGRPSAEFWLTKKQAIYIATKAETERATEITIQIVEVFDAVTSGKALPPPPPAPALTKADLDAIDQRARALGEAEERRVRAALTADALERVRRGQPVDVGAVPVSAPTPLLSAPSIPVPPPTGTRGGWEALAPGERSLIQNFRDMTPARQEQFTRLMSTAAAYAEALRELWKATAVADMWDSIAEMIENHAHRFRQRIPLG